jgi:arylsulfatase A-like enzyme
MKTRNIPLLASAALLGQGAIAAPIQNPESKIQNPNILFIAIDDYRDWANYLGYHQAKTPNLDRLAAMGTAFTRGYCAAPVCNPSRTALLTGLRPSTTGVYTNTVDWRTNPAAQSVPTIPVWFRDHGYTSCASGKIYHESMRKAEEWDDYNPLYQLKNPPGAAKDAGVKGLKFRPLNLSDGDMPDYQTVSYCIDRLNRKFDKPLFLGCGFTKPHLPWEVPQKYYDMYDLEKIQLPKVPENDLDDVPPAGVAMARKGGHHAAILKSGRWKEAVRAYLATITFMDAQIGRLLDAFEKSAYRDNTIIVLWSDHGWHLGEKEHWSKFALWEESTRSPFIWVVPGMTKPGSFCHRTVDFMGIYPTLCELAGIPTPAHVEGKSIAGLLKNPGATWDTPAVTTHEYQNHAVRTEKWRYIRYADGGEELYDHDNDPLEWKNLAPDRNHAAVKDELKTWLPKTNVPMPKGASKRNVPGNRPED